MRTDEGEAAAAGRGLDLQVGQSPRDDGLHLPAEETHTLRLACPWLLQDLCQRCFELRQTPNEASADGDPLPCRDDMPQLGRLLHVIEARS